MNKSLIEVQAGYDEPEDDLTWLARNVHEWPTDCLLRSHGVAMEDGRIVAIYRQYADQTTSDKTYTKDQWQSRRAELQNKPSFKDHPDAKCFVQTKPGNWHKNTATDDVIPECGDWVSRHQNSKWVHIQHGEVIGDWKNTLEKRPEKREFNPSTSSMTFLQQIELSHKTGLCSDGIQCGKRNNQIDGYCPECPNHFSDTRNIIKYPEQPLDMADPLSDLTVSIKPTACCASMSELYPKYYKDVSKLTEVDVYAIHDLFAIDDPSGCIQHASKKLLLCGVRTGGKPAAQEIKEARDTLTRKLQLMGIE